MILIKMMILIPLLVNYKEIIKEKEDMQRIYNMPLKLKEFIIVYNGKGYS